MNYYDTISQGYDKLHGDEQISKLKVIAKHISVHKETTILDVGCGTGLSAKVFDAKITGIDPSIEMLKKCPFNTVLGTAEKLPFRDKSFDYVICVTAFHHFDPKAFTEIKRTAKKAVVLSLLKKSEKTYRFIANLDEKPLIFDHDIDKILIFLF